MDSTVMQCDLNRVIEYMPSGAIARFRVGTRDTSARVEVSICAPGVVRYRMLLEGDTTSDNIDLLAPGWQSSDAVIQSTELQGKIVLESRGTVVEVHREPWRVVVLGADSNPLVSEAPLDVNVRGVHQSKPTGFDLEDGRAIRCRVTLTLDPEDHLFGLGEKPTDFDKRGQEIVCWNRNAYGAGTERTYKNVPLVVSNRRYGVFLNDARRSVWRLGCESNFATTIEVEGPGMDLFILTGETLKDVLAKYADLTGHSPVPPRWSFSPVVSLGAAGLPWEQLNEKAMLELAKEIRRRELPCDILHIDTPWMGDAGYCNFEWDRVRWPHPEDMIAALRRLDFRLCLWESPCIDIRTDMYREGTEKGFLLKRENGTAYNDNLVWISPARKDGSEEHIEKGYDPGGIIDFSNPKAVEWWKEKHRALLEMGVATFKSDFGEEIPVDALFANGKTGREMRNAYPLLYHKATFEAVAECTDRPVLLCGRAGFAGSQRMPVQWDGDPAGDFPSLAATIRAGLSYGMSGVPFWAILLGGFTMGEHPREQYVRWVQTGLLISHCLYQGSAGVLPWLHGEEVFRIVQKFHQLRYRLLPYLYSLSLEAARRGIPIMRPLVLEFEDDPGSLATELEFMLGPSLLVVPVLNPEGRVNVYLPPGTWYDLWSGEEFHGPSVRKLTVGLDQMPIYVRSNAILPTAEAGDIIPDLWDPLTIELYPEASGRLEIPEDGGRVTTEIDVSREHGSRIEAHGPERVWRFLVREIECPSHVHVSSKGNNEWKYLRDKRAVEIKAGPSEHVEALL